MSDPLYIAAKMALAQFRRYELFENNDHGYVFNQTLAHLQNAIEAYEANAEPVARPLTPGAWDRDYQRATYKKRLGYAITPEEEAGL